MLRSRKRWAGGYSRLMGRRIEALGRFRRKWTIISKWIFNRWNGKAWSAVDMSGSE
jgi:hypothetical protein